MADTRFLELALDHGGDPNLYAKAIRSSVLYPRDRSIETGGVRDVGNTVEQGADLNAIGGCGESPLLDAVSVQL